VGLSQFKIDLGAGAKQSALWAGNKLVTRYTESAILNFFRQYCVFPVCCGSGLAAMSIMTICPRTAAEGYANICVQDNKKLNPI
jgi:hypothetical protein